MGDRAGGIGATDRGRMIYIPIDAEPYHRHSAERMRVATEIKFQRAFLRPPISGKVKSYEIERAEDKLLWNRRLAKALRDEESYLNFCMARRILAKLTRTELEEPYSLERQRRAWAAEIRDARLPYAGLQTWSYDDDAKARGYAMARKLRDLAHRQIVEEV